jgi:hypothetical protein
MNESADLLEFLDHICVKLGFCLSATSRSKIASGGPYRPEDIARIVLDEEGLNPDCEVKQFRALRNEFINFLGR